MALLCSICGGKRQKETPVLCSCFFKCKLYFNNYLSGKLSIGEKKNWTQRHTCVLLFIQTLCKPGNNRLPCQLSGKPSTRGRKTPVACFCFFKCKLYQLPCQATVCCHGRKESHQRKKNILDSVSKGSTQNPTFR